jgi:hypothetical protein
MGTGCIAVSANPFSHRAIEYRVRDSGGAVGVAADHFEFVSQRKRDRAAQQVVQQGSGLWFHGLEMARHRAKELGGRRAAPFG